MAELSNSAAFEGISEEQPQVSMPEAPKIKFKELQFGAAFGTPHSCHEHYSLHWPRSTDRRIVMTPLNSIRVHRTPALLVFFVLAVVLGLFSIWRLNNFNRLSANVTQVWLPNMRVLGDLNGFTSDFRALEGSSLISSNPVEVAASEKRMVDLDRSIADAERDYERISRDAAEDYLYDRFEKRWREYRLIVDQIATLSRTNRKAEALAIYGSTSRAAYDAASNELSLLTDQTAANARAASDRLSVVYWQASWLILLGMVIAAIISVIAIENTRLLKEVRRRSRELEQSLELLERERNNKLMTMDALAASIAHEVRQPLTVIASSGGAAVRYLCHTPPNIEEARIALKRIVDDSHRASQIFENIRLLFGKSDPVRVPIDMRVLIGAVLQMLRKELDDHRVTLNVNLPPDLPSVMGHRGQLQEVFINLVKNAIEAMSGVDDGRRVLKLQAERHGDDAVLVSVEDSGTGIDPERLERIFDAFVTTKTEGTGLGLAICRMIIERHQGKLSAAAAHPRGAVFRVVLPIRSSGGA